MKKVRIVFLGIVLLFLAVPFASAAENNVSKLTLAIEDARRKAEVAAKAAGLKLGRVLEISEGYGYVAAASKSATYDMATPIQPGQMEITASVTMTYEIS